MLENVLGALAVSSLIGAVDVAFVSVSDRVVVGEDVEVAVYLYSDSADTQLVAAAQVIMAWDAAALQLVENNQNGAVNLLSSGFPNNDPYGLNEASPPQDGDGLYQALALLGQPVAATPEGTLLTTLRFTTLQPAEDSPIQILPMGGSPPGETIVYDGTTPNTNVTGTLFGTLVTILPGCPADLNQDELINVLDLLILLSEWGPCETCAADLHEDGEVNMLDLLAILSAWGACP